MELNEEKVKALFEYGQKVVAVEFAGEVYFVVESGKLTADVVFSAQKDYFLFDKNFKNIGFLYLSEQKYGEGLIASAKREGVLDVPEFSVSLSHIEIEEDYRRRHLGDFLLNKAIKDVCDLSQRCSVESIPIMFVRANSAQTLPFYRKWGAVDNQRYPNEDFGLFNCMIIKSPTPKAEYDGKVLKEITMPKETKNEEGRNF